MTQKKPQRAELDRVVTFRDYISIGFGVMVGVGWVIYAGEWIKSGGAFGAALAFIIGGLLLVPVGKCYGELTSSLPLSGGEFSFAYKAFGPTSAFLVAWALALAYVAIVPFETIAVGAMVEAIAPIFATEALYEVSGYKISITTVLSGVLVGLLVIWINWRGARDMARMQTFVMYLLVACTLAFSLVAFLKGDISHLKPLFAGKGDFWTIAPASIAAVIVVTPFFFSGFDCIPQAAEEAGTKMPAQKLGTAIVSTIGLGIIFYVLVILALGYSVPNATILELSGQKDSLPMAEVFRISFGYEWAAKLVLFAALLGIISTLNGSFMAATRLLFSLGRGGMLPSWFVQLHSEHHTPKNAIIFVGAIAVAGPLFGKAGLTYIVNSSSFVFSVVFLIASIAVWRLRRIAPELERPYRINKLTIVVSAVVSLLLIALMVMPGSPGQLQQGEWIAIAIWMLLGVSFYGYRRSKRDLSPEDQAYLILGKYQ